MHARVQWSGQADPLHLIVDSDLFLDRFSRLAADVAVH